MQGGVCAEVLELILTLRRLLIWVDHDQDGKWV